MFKEIRALFSVAKDTAFETGQWHRNRTEFKFEVKRYESGCFAYGDRSAHSVEIVNHPEAFMYHFDTRYSQIKTTKEEWIAFWKEWIQNEYTLEVKLDEYEEREVKEREEK